MKKTDTQVKNPRREFLGSLAAGAATFGISTLASPFSVSAMPASGIAEADAWFDKVKGKHRVVFDVPAPHEIFQFAWPRAFLLSNIATGTPESDLGVVVVLRHSAIGFAMEDRLWEKYKLGEVFKVTDGATKAPALRNPFWKPKPDDYVIPGLGNLHIGINELQDSGVMICVCDTAMTAFSGMLAHGMEPAEVKKDLISGILPSIQIVPSGVWALGRAQEKKCAYIFVG
jgi:intracellular sulfur oxidation DsrE/DsrF family protein